MGQVNTLRWEQTSTVLPPELGVHGALLSSPCVVSPGAESRAAGRSHTRKLPGLGVGQMHSATPAGGGKHGSHLLDVSTGFAEQSESPRSHFNDSRRSEMSQSCPTSFATSLDLAHQVPLSDGLCRHKYWSR